MSPDQKRYRWSFSGPISIEVRRPDGDYQREILPKGVQGRVTGLLRGRGPRARIIGRITALQPSQVRGRFGQVVSVGTEVIVHSSDRQK